MKSKKPTKKQPKKSILVKEIVRRIMEEEKPRFVRSHVDGKKIMLNKNEKW